MFNLISFLLVLSLAGVQCQIGDVCKTEDGSDGSCISILNCPPLIKQLKEAKYVKPCSFKGTLAFVCCKTEAGAKAKKKCEEYGQLVLDVQYTVGGTPSKKNQFPHMVALGYENGEGISWHCGGSLISEEYVLTAAHCLNSRLGSVKFARLGTVDLKNPEQGGKPQDFQILQAISHPDYKYPSKYNDIALLKLNSKADFNKFVRPACLQADFIINATKYVGTGWGFLEAGGPLSDVLMNVDLVPYSYDDCRRTYGNDLKSLPSGILEETQICAGGSEGEERDTCNGDSGGPIQFFSDIMYSVVGVTSFGKECGRSNISAVYTRVSNYIAWIEDIVWP